MDITTDRISNLPCNVMDHILKYLPLHEAVRTSVLSKGWQYKWVTTPYLVFDESFEEALVGGDTTEFIIYQILLLHKGPIVKFACKVSYDFDGRPAVDHWLYFLSNHRIQVLTLGFSTHQTIPHHLFTFDQLRHLSLERCKLRPPSTFIGLGRLVTLDLKDVLIELEELRRFITKCPMLSHLNLYNYSCNTTVADFEIDAPNLKYFCFRGKVPSICFKNTFLLEEVSISLSRSTTHQAPLTDLIEFFSQLSSIKSLKFDRRFLHLLARGGVPQKLPDNLSRLMVLQLSYVDFVSIAGVTCAVCLIRSSPNLQSLEITSTTTRDGDVEPAVQFLKEQQNCKLTLSHLRNVKIDSFSGSEPEMEFVKLLLSAAATLTKLELVITHHVQSASKEGYQMFKKLAGFRRASSEAEIITHDSKKK